MMTLSLKRVAAYVPWTSQARARRYAQLRQTEMVMRGKLNFVERRLTSVEAIAFARSIRRAAKATILLRRLRVFVAVTSGILICLSLLVALAFIEQPTAHVDLPTAAEVQRAADQARRTQSAFLTFVVATAVCCALVVAELRYEHILPDRIVRRVLTGVLLLGSVALADSAFALFPEGVWSPVRNGLAAATIVCATSVVVVFTGGNVLLAGERAWGKASPESRMTYMLAMAVHEIRGVKWQKLACRQRAMIRLERVAYALEHYVPKFLNPPHGGVRLWVQERYVHMAALPRELQKWIAAPHADTYEYLCRELMSLLSRILRHDWGAIYLPSVDQIPQTSPRASEMLKRCVVAVIPWAGIGVIAWSGLLRDAVVSSWLIAGAYIWTVGVVLLALDPVLAARMAALRDLKRILDVRDAP